MVIAIFFNYPCKNSYAYYRIAEHNRQFSSKSLFLFSNFPLFATEISNKFIAYFCVFVLLEE